jgi:hypothetical protein
MSNTEAGAHHSCLLFPASNFSAPPKPDNAVYNLDDLQSHFETHRGAKGKRVQWDPVKKLHQNFAVVEFEAIGKHNLWIYSTLGMSLDRVDENLIELHMFSSKQDPGLVELLVAVAAYHRNDTPLNLYHTINFGRSWQDRSQCTYGYISLPYLDGESLEVFSFGSHHLHNLWLLPITEQEREFKINEGWEALEEKFERLGLDYATPGRPSCV